MNCKNTNGILSFIGHINGTTIISFKDEPPYVTAEKSEIRSQIRKEYWSKHPPKYRLAPKDLKLTTIANYSYGYPFILEPAQELRKQQPFTGCWIDVAN